MASQDILKKIHDLVKKGFPNATSVGICVNGDIMTANPNYEVGRKVWRQKSIVGKAVDEVEVEEE